MDIEQFIGTTVRKSGFEHVYRTVVEKLGGVDAIRPYIPFSDDILRQSYAEDRYFNTSLTPLRKWDEKSGIHVRNGHLGSSQPVATGNGIFQLAAKKGITRMSQSQAICILKTAAEMICIEQNTA